MAKKKKRLGAANAAPNLQTMVAPVSSLEPHPENVRIHSEENLQAIMKSLKEYGQQKPIVVGKDNLVLAGCGTLEAAKRLDWKTISIVLTNLSGEQALAYAIADNKTTDMSEFDFHHLSKVMRTLAEAGVDLSVTGFAEFEIEPLLQADWSPPAVGEMPDGQEEPGVHVVKFTGETWELVAENIERFRQSDSDTDEQLIARAVQPRAKKRLRV